MKNGVEQQAVSKYDDSAADAVAALAVLTVVIGAVVFWLSGQ